LSNPSATPLTLLLATTNEAKANRLRTLLDGLNVALETPASMVNPPVVAEEGESHLAIAEQKALAWSKAFDGLALASDGGLVVPALGTSWASLTTRRASGETASDTERAGHLLERMRQYRGMERAVMWVEALALADRGSLVESFHAEGLKGLLAEEYQPAPGGAPGFWVDGLWLHATNGKRHWELTKDELASAGDPWGVLASLLRNALKGVAGGA
jgi:inosine/xanthosine triphosphate pyrophosphatase family protein